MRKLSVALFIALLLCFNAYSGEPISYTYQSTFRAAESLAVQANGDIGELRGTAGVVARVKRLVIAKPTGAFNLTIVKRSSLDTGGTPTSVVSVPMDTLHGGPSLTFKAYTVKPTPGTTLGSVYAPVNIATGDVIGVDFGDTRGSESLTIRSGEAFTFTSDTAVTLSYMIEWTEDTH